jgi:hypothetical protein
MYGRVPTVESTIRVEERRDEPGALGGLATRTQFVIRFQAKPDDVGIRVLLYRPESAGEGSIPVFLGLNFGGNHAVSSDPGVELATCWFRDNPGSGYVNHKATEATRGNEASRWQVEKVLKRGYALVTACYNDIDPDFDDGFRNGVHGLFDPPGQARNSDAWGSIAAWAWGLSRILDVLQNEPGLDRDRVAVLGHSRLGKTALWAGAQDERFALVISNNSGEGGAALSRRRFGETTRLINTNFPHWFCENYKKYNDREDDLPFDQHELIALIAPRPVLVSSADQDLWADPRGEFLSALGADPVYRLLGVEGLDVQEQPAVGKPVLSRVGYHLRAGAHDVTAEDWEVFLDFADRHLRKAK